MADTTTASTPPPRNGKLTDQQKHEILAITANGSSRRFAAKCVGCATSTITHLMRRDPEFRAQMNRAECLAAIRQAGKQPRLWKARAWLLERLDPERFALRPPKTYTIPQVADFDQPGGGATPAQNPGSDSSVDDSVTQAEETTYDDAPADASTQRVEVRGATPARNSSGSGVTSSSPIRPPEVPPHGFSLGDLTDPSPTAGFRIVRDWPEDVSPIIPDDGPDLPRRNPKDRKENSSRGSSASAGNGARRASNPHPEPRKER